MKNIFGGWKKKTELEKQIDTVMEQMSRTELGSKEYTELLNVLDKLNNMRNKGEKKEIPWAAIIMCGTGLLQTIMILHAEQVGVITSRAVGFIIKGRA